MTFPLLLSMTMSGNGQRAAREWIDTLSAKLPVDEDGTYVNGIWRVREQRSPLLNKK
jgi:hypothetical protein